MESPLNKEYDDIMLEGAFEGAFLTERYEVIERIDGLSGQGYNIRHNTKRLAEKKGADRSVASGIATAILDSLVIYGDIGKKFLNEKLEQEGESFSQLEYSQDVAKSITELYQYDRKQKIIDGIEAFYNDDSDNVEATIARTSIMAEEYFSEARYPEGHLLEERLLNGEISSVINSEKIMKRLQTMHYKAISEEQAIKNLNIAYQYLSENYDKVTEDFKEEFPHLSKSRMICYRIANLHDTEMQKLLNLAKKKKLDER